MSKRQIAEDLEFFVLRGGEIQRDGDEFIIDPHQLFPARYLSHHRNNSVLCYNAYMGTGKSLAAALVLAPLIERIAYLTNCFKGSDQRPTLPKPYVVGNWSTIEAFDEELFRPMFNIVSEEEYEELLIARVKNDQEEQERLRALYERRVRQRVKMMSYQKLFNQYFKGSLDLAEKDEVSIRTAIKDGKITIDASIVEELNDSILVVDETQSFYSANGWNSYGVLLDHIWQNPKINGLKVLHLSGTFINTSAAEIIHLANLIRDRGSPLLKVNDYLTKVMIEGQSYVYDVKPGKKEALIALFDGKVAYYGMPQSDDYPETKMVGESVTFGKSKLEWLKLYRCKAPLYQWNEYVNEVRSSDTTKPPITKKRQQKEEMEDIEEITNGVEEEIEEVAAVEEDQSIAATLDSEESIARDFVLPPKGEWKKYKVEPIEGARDVYSGDWLKLENLRSMFGTIPAELVSYLLDIVKAKRGQKVACYHRRVERGGILQYSEALRANGFTRYGDIPLSDAICHRCSLPLSRHAKFKISMNASMNASKEIKPKAKRSSANGDITNHEFIPTTFAVMIGRLAYSERAVLKVQFNSPDNADGSQIMCLLLSGVGEKGLTLMGTNHMLTLDSVPGISLLRQIKGRLARHSTHRNLPPEKRWVKLVVMTIAPPKGSPHKYSREEFRYLLSEINDKIIMSVWIPIQSRSVNCALTDQKKSQEPISCTYKVTKVNIRSREVYDTFYYAADVNAVKAILKECLNNISPIWRVPALRKAILSNEIRKVPWNTSYVSDEAIAEGIIEMCSEKQTVLLRIGNKTPIDGLKVSQLTNKNLILTRGGEHGMRPFTAFTRPTYLRNISWRPITGDKEAFSPDELKHVIGEIGEAGGMREKSWLLDQIIGKTNAIDIIERDFSKRGPVYELFEKLGSVVWVGDESDHVTYAKNRLKMRPRTPIGFILGPNYYKEKDGEWKATRIPNKSTDGEHQWDICGVFSSGSALEAGRWHPRFKVRPKQEKVSDLRKVQDGMACLSLPSDTLKRYIKILNVATDLPKTSTCIAIEQSLLKRQVSSEGKNVRFIYTPFESLPTNVTRPTEIKPAVDTGIKVANLSNADDTNDTNEGASLRPNQGRDIAYLLSIGGDEWEGYKSIITSQLREEGPGFIKMSVSMVKEGATDIAIREAIRERYLSSKREDRTGGRAVARVEQLKKALPPDLIPTSVLDIGCGSGTITAAIASEYKLDKAYVHCADIEESVDEDGFTFKHLDAPGKLPYTDGQFDLIVAFMSLHHVTEILSMHAEIRRVMSKGGYLVIREHDRLSPDHAVLIDLQHSFHALVWPATREMTEEEFSTNYYSQYRSKEEWTTGIERTGFKHILGDFNKSMYGGRPAQQNPFGYYYACYRKE